MSEEKELTSVKKALKELSTKEYHEGYVKGFKSLAKIQDEMLNGEYEDEEDVVGTNALDIPCYALHNQGFFRGYEAGIKNGGCTWISCLDELPDPEEHDRVLVCTEPKASQKNNNNITIMAASVMKHHKKEGTHWMPLPKFE